ncbi:MAG: hypothetical protein ACO3QC_12385 [Phycisphaerales bacterium]
MDRRTASPPALLGVIAAIAGIAASTGCATSRPSQAAPYIVVSKGAYPAAVDAACAAARAAGFVPVLVDRGAGTIETEPKAGGSMVEPWTWNDHTVDEVVEGTLAFERRRVRFEFVPVGFEPVASNADAPLAGPVLPGSGRGSGAAIDRVDGDLELRVAVSVERQFQPGLQRNSWTRSVGGVARDVTVPDDGRALRDRSTWTPIARDERLEQLLLARVREQLAAE